MVDIAGDAFGVSVSVHGERGDMGSSILCSSTNRFSSEIADGVEPGFMTIGLYCFCVDWGFFRGIGSGGLKADFDKCSTISSLKPLSLSEALTVDERGSPKLVSMSHCGIEDGAGKS
jgi:hypothetical protein